MNPARGPAFVERLLDQAARRLSAAGLHPLRLRDDIVSAFDASLHGRDVANDLRVAIHPADHARLASELDSFRDDMLALLAARAGERGWSTLGDLQLAIAPSASVSPGAATVEARFSHRNASHAHSGTAPNATRRLTPVRHLRLLLPGGETFPVTHLPFAIGRAPGNDLVLASMAVSRSHAELTRTAAGVAIRDCGSFNGVVIAGERVTEALLADGTVFALGDIELRVRFDAQ